MDARIKPHYLVKTFDLRNMTNEAVTSAMTTINLQDGYKLAQSHLHQEEFTLVVIFEREYDYS